MLGEIQFVMINGFINERPIPLVGFVGENDARQIKVITFDDMSTVSVTELVIGDIEAGIFESEQKTIPVFDRLSGGYIDRTQTTLSIYLNEEMLGDAGLKFLQLVMYNETGEIVKKTNQFIVRVGDSNTPIYYAPGTKTVKTLETYVKEITEEAIKLAFGLQEEVTSSNDFVNKKVLYVYKGNEEDYQNGYWYYYDDTQKKWVPGGPYKNPTDEVLRLLAQKQDVLTFDSTPTEDSQNPVTSDGVFRALAGHQITMDEFPINGSTNPVTSDGLYRKFGEVDAQHQSLSTRVGRIQEEQTDLANGVQQNTTDIAQNTSDISQNASDISLQGITIAEHQTSISENTDAIEEVRGIANSASTKADAVDARLDNIIVESGTSDAETIAARTNANTGITYTTLGQRLDAENSEIKEDLSDEIGVLKDAFGEYSETAYITPDIDSTFAGVTAFTEADGTLRLYGTPTEYRRFACLCGQKAIKFSNSSFEKTLDAGVYRITSSISGYKNSFQWVYTYTTFADQQTLIDTSSPSKTVVFTQPVMVGLQLATNQDWGTSETPTHITFSAEKLSAKDPVARSEISTIRALKYSVSDQIDPGTMNIESGTSGNAYSSFWRYRKQARMVKIGTKPVTISFLDVSADLITSIRIYKYSEINGTVTFVGYSSAYTLTDGKYTYTPQSGVNVIKVTLTPVESSYNDFGRVLFQSEDPLEIVYNHAIGNSAYEGNVTFAYVVSGNTYTSGQMILPPNYRISGNPVPLYVNVHGTGPMATWTAIFAETGTTTKQRNRNNYEYMANEGFAVLDLYPWTSKYYSADSQVSPVNISVHQRAFIEGIKYVCTRYNIDITNVGMSFKSLGGNLGHFFMHQAEIPIRAIAMLAPSTSYMSTVWNTLFLLNSDGGVALRSRVVEILGLTGETNAQLFIDTDRGMNNVDVMQFVEDHIDKFAHLNIAGYGVNGATLADIFEWSRTGVSTLPQWLQDKGFTTIASRWTTSPARGVPSVVNHPGLSKHSNVPVKFWQAPDDVNTSFHVNYTVYQWLLNSGSDVDFRVLPENTGGHHALDTDDNALKSSGTTRLGIAYTDVATVYVEMADFFYNKMTL